MKRAGLCKSAAGSQRLVRMNRKSEWNRIGQPVGLREKGAERTFKKRSNGLAGAGALCNSSLSGAPFENQVRAFSPSLDHLFM